MMDKHTFFRPQLSSPSRQSGIALFVCLLFTLMITMVAVVSIQSNTLNERIAGNARDKTLAFQAAEAALRDAETFMASAAGAVVNFNDTNGFYDSSDGNLQNWSSVAGGYAHYSGAALNGVVANPQYVVEQLPDDLFSEGSIIAGQPKTTSPNMYRITSIANGNSANSLVVLQSIYRRKN